MSKLNTYRIAGNAFEGDPFDETFESALTFPQFVNDDLHGLTGIGTDNPDVLATHIRNGVTVMPVSDTKVVIEGYARLYLIEQIGFAETDPEAEQEYNVDIQRVYGETVSVMATSPEKAADKALEVKPPTFSTLSYHHTIDDVDVDADVRLASED